MSFTQRFGRSALATLLSPPIVQALEIAPGSFEGGLFSVLDHDLSHSVMESWRWLLGDDAVALVATALGDLFFWSEKHGAVFFLEVQYGKSTFIDRDVDYFFGSFLTQDGVLDDVLQRPFCQSIEERAGPISYGSCYIAEPWIGLGGAGTIDTYVRGGLVAYVRLVGQAVEREFSARRGGR